MLLLSGERARARAVVVVVVTILAVMLGTARPAAATGLTSVVFTANAVLNQGFGTCGGNGAFSGQASGIHGATLLGLTPIYGQFTYCDPLLVTGMAAGQFRLDGDECAFTWQQLGAVVVMRIDGGPMRCLGAAVFGYLPTSVPGSVPATAAMAGGEIHVHFLLDAATVQR